MENNELQKLWKNIDLEINQKPKEELKLLLASKAKQTINKFLIIVSISILVCAGLLVFLTITSLNRLNDMIYLMNNLALGIITLLSLSSVLISWYKLKSNKYNMPLKDWLEMRINILSKGLTGRFSRLYLYLIPVLYILSVLSIHVYYEDKLFTEVLKTEESIIGLFVGTLIGLAVAYYGATKIRKFQINNLEFLRDLYNRLSNV